MGNGQGNFSLNDLTGLSSFTRAKSTYLRRSGLDSGCDLLTEIQDCGIAAVSCLYKLCDLKCHPRRDHDQHVTPTTCN